ncbi:MAG: phosphatidylglycerophosphate synthase [Planctomycetota bacterium]|jgi:phosphatidylglycerophosphate synthase
MTKLPKEHKFLDLSDYGRRPARTIANAFKNTRITPVHVTWMFVVSGLIAIYFILNNQFYLAALFLVLKSILDAADGELARVKNTPSYTGRYFDSISDIILNALFLITIAYITNAAWYMTLLAFIGIQLQGTLYNYYYVILRNRNNGDNTSRIFETITPKAFPQENQKTVTILFKLYNLLYRVFDLSIYFLDKNAVRSQNFPSWFMTMISIFGLGFQLLFIATMLMLGLANYILPSIIIASGFILVFVAIRKTVLNNQKAHSIIS